MAASSSDESSTAPRDFHLSSSLDSGSRLSPNKRKCPLCHKYRKVFYCKECVHSGLFYRSKSQATEGFSDTKKTLLELQENKKVVESNCLKLLEIRAQADVLQSKIRVNNERNRILKLSVEEKNKKKVLYTKKLIDLKQLNEKRERSLPKYDKKVQQMEQFVGDRQEKLERARDMLEQKKIELARIARMRVQQLMKYIFPITKIQPIVSETEFSDSEMVIALAEASQTSFKDGWEYTDNNGEMKYSIVAPTLPGSGNYFCYNIWLAQLKQGNGIPIGSISTIDHRNPAYSITAALTYTTQLVQILSYFLDVGLPYKLFYSDFCNKELTEQQFNKRLARLNANILYLCISQNVELSSLRSTQTIHNILKLVDEEKEDLGRNLPLELDDEQVTSLEEPIVADLLNGDDSDSDEGTSFFDWEALPNMQYPEVSAGPANIQSTQVISAQQASIMGGGLVNSAAASIFSIWKGFTGGGR